MSPVISSGIMIPVEAFPPKTSANRVTINTEIPLRPDLDIPNKNAARMAKNQCHDSNWYCAAKVK